MSEELEQMLDLDNRQAPQDIASETGESLSFIHRAKRKFKKLMHEELLKIGIIECENYCKKRIKTKKGNK